MAVFDKTGGLTAGQPRVGRIEGPESHERILRLAASLDQPSGHVVGRALVDEAHARGLILGRPTEVTEIAGSGISGKVEGVRVSVGGDTYFDAESPAGATAGALCAKVFGAGGSDTQNKNMPVVLRPMTSAVKPLM